jgi:hypothetical protein
MGIQFKQVDNLQSTFDALSGDLQGQITPLTGVVDSISSGAFGFKGEKYFEGNVDFSGAQGIYVDPNNIYTPNTIFASAIKVGGGISSPRNSTPLPDGVIQISGGTSFFDGPLTMRNDSTLTALTVTGGSGEFHRGYLGEITTSGLVVSGATNTVVNLRELPYESGTLPSGSLFRSGNHIMIV